MSTTVQYKGNTLTTVSNDTKTLKTAGKYMEGDVVLTDVSGGSEAISVVDTLDANGGTIRTITAVDISDTTAVASDVAQGKYFYTADGTKTPGTSTGGSGGSKWVRPSDWPDLSKMDVSSGDILYMTSYADEGRGFCSFYVTCTGSYTVEIGTISGTTFTAESTHTYSSNSYCDLYYGSANGTYKVLRVTGTAISKLYLRPTATVTIDTFHGYTSNQGIIDIVGKLPSSTGKALNCGSQYNLVNVEISNITLTGSCNNMFINCSSLASVDVSGWDTSGVTNMSYMFNSCYSLISLDISEWDTSEVTNMSYIFNNCHSLTSLDVSEWNTSGVTNMSDMFNNCYRLTSLDVSKWDTSGVTNITNIFNGCHSLTSLDVSKWDTSGVTSIGNVFSGCISLTSLDVSKWDTSGATSMSYTFYNCYSLTSLDVSGWDTSGVTNMSYMFGGCYSLTSLDVSEWDTSEVTNMSYMFYNCRSLASLDISGWDFTKVIIASSASSIFSSCYGLHGSLTLPTTMTMIGSSCFSGTQSIYEYHFLATTPPTLNNTNAFNNMTDFGGKKIYVPSASLEAYQTAANWSTYASYMVGE